MSQVRSLQTGVKFKDTPIGKLPVDWEVAKIEDLCDVIGGSTPSTTHKGYWNGDILWATPTDITSLKGRIIGDTKQRITPEGLEACAATLLPAGSILMTSRATIGACAINSKPMATNQGFANLICKDDVYNWFLYYLISLRRKELDMLGSGSTFKEVSKKSIKAMRIQVPPLKEQKKMAKILTTADEAIEQTDAVIEKTKELKKGLMQQLLARGIGHTEFKDTPIGKLPVDWELAMLRDVSLEFISGGTPSTKKMEYWNGDIAWMTSAHINHREITRGMRNITSEGLKNSATKIVPPNSLLIATRVGVGKTAINRINIAISQDLTGIVLNTNKIDVDYAYWSLYSHADKIAVLSQGSAIKGLLRKEIEEIRIPLPTLEEQKKIAEILTAVDEEIEQEENHKRNLETQKKALMQVLLTGKTRVKTDA